MRPDRLSLPPGSVTAQNDKRLHAKVQQVAEQTNQPRHSFAESSNGSAAQTWVDLPRLRQYREAASNSSNSDGPIHSRSSESYLDNDAQLENAHRPPSRQVPAHFEQQLPSFSNNLHERPEAQYQHHSQPLQRATFEHFAAPRAGPTPFNPSRAEAGRTCLVPQNLRFLNLWHRLQRRTTRRPCHQGSPSDPQAARRGRCSSRSPTRTRCKAAPKIFGARTLRGPKGGRQVRGKAR